MNFFKKKTIVPIAVENAIKLSATNKVKEMNKREKKINKEVDKAIKNINKLIKKSSKKEITYTIDIINYDEISLFKYTSEDIIDIYSNYGYFIDSNEYDDHITLIIAYKKKNEEYLDKVEDDIISVYEIDNNLELKVRNTCCML